MHRFLVVTTAVLGLVTAPALASTRLELNGEWQFKIDSKSEGERAGWAKAIPALTETVRVPHTWGIGAHEDHAGLAWYFRTFNLPQEQLNGYVEVHFGATFYRSRVWLNGALLGGHEGGHTAYALDATGHVRAENLLAVEIDNRPSASTLPGVAMRWSKDAWYDWWPYGGIVRDAWLSVHDAALLRRQRIRTRVEGQTALVSDLLAVENHAGAALNVKLALTARGPAGAAVGRMDKALTLRPGAQEVLFELRIDPVRLWRLDDPQLYSLEARLVDAGGKILDSLTDHFGARTLTIKDRKLYLNGDHVRLTGITRHADSPWEGLAETPGTMLHDYDDLKALHVTLTRPVHYPQHAFILDYCDRNGILLIPEIPMWGFGEEQMKDPKVLALAKQMMQEMIEEAGNHPSIMAWSVCNESTTDKPAGVAYVKAMRELTKSLDPDRFVTYADDSAYNADDPKATAAVLADFVMMNQYFGSWAGPAGLLPEKIERLGRLLPDKMVIISEFGLAGIFAPDKVTADEQRCRIIREQMAEFARHDFIGGAIFWCYQDYKSHRNLRPGETKGFVEMGLVDEWRQRRPSWSLWHELNAPARVTVAWNQTYETPTAFRATLVPRNETEIPSYRLRGWLADWEVRDDDDRSLAKGSLALGELAGPREISGAWAPASSKALKLRFRLVRPDGSLALDETFSWWQPRAGGIGVQ
jgi:beta-glucuronidase